MTVVSNRSAPTATRSQRRPGRPKGGGVLADRTQLLAAAERAIRADGPDLTMAELAAAATVSKPILYRTVGDRDALVFALSEALVDRISIAVDAATEAAPSPHGEFAAAVRGYLAAVDVDRNLFLFVNAGGHHTDQLRRLVDRSAAQMIEQFDAMHTVRGKDPAAARTWAHAIVGALQISTMMWLRDEYCDIDTLADQLTQLIWPGIRDLAQ